MLKREVIKKVITKTGIKHNFRLEFFVLKKLSKLMKELKLLQRICNY